MTVVILIILATVSISVTFGENGLIAKTKQAKQDSESATTNEQEKLEQLDQEFANMMAEPPPDPTANWDLSKVKKVTSDDNVVVPVPIGYTASTVTGEKRVDTGFVIKEGSNGGATEGINEFVWVPVADSSTMFGIDSEGNALGKLYEFGTRSKPDNPPKAKNWTEENGIMNWTSNISNREPDVVTNASEGSDSTSGSEYDAVTTNLEQAGFSSDLNNDGEIDAKDFKLQLQKEFKTMKESVEEYGGFYIGRYETGNLSTNTAVVQKNNSDINEQTWYTQYKLSKTIAANSNAISSIIWGCQWDATLRWFQTSSKTEVANFPTNSEGNYAGTQGSTNKTIPTGSNPAYAVNNIYDMAGNVYDLTLEVHNIGSRTTRGCYYGSTVDTSSASVHNGGYPS